MRNTEAEQIRVIGNRGLSGRAAMELFVRNGGIPDGIMFTEIFSGKTLIVSALNRLYDSKENRACNHCSKIRFKP